MKCDYCHTTVSYPYKITISNGMGEKYEYHACRKCIASLYPKQKTVEAKVVKVTTKKTSKGIGTAESAGIGTAVKDSKECGIGTAIKDERKH